MPKNFPSGKNPRTRLVGSEEDDARYLDRMCQEYVENLSLSFKGLSEREQRKGIPLNHDILDRALARRGVKKTHRRAKPYIAGEITVRLEHHQWEAYKMITASEMSASLLMRIAFDLITGQPVRHVIIFWDDYRRIIFSEKHSNQKISVITIGEFDTTQQRIFQRRCDIASVEGIESVKRWAETEGLIAIGCNCSAAELSKIRYHNS